MYVSHIPGIESLQDLVKITKKQKIDSGQIEHGNRGFWYGMSLRNCEKTGAKGQIGCCNLEPNHIHKSHIESLLPATDQFCLESPIAFCFETTGSSNKQTAIL